MQQFKPSEHNAYAYPSFYKSLVSLLLSITLLLLAGCSTFRSHDSLMTPVINLNKTQGAAAALNKLRSSLSKSDQTKLLYTMELGELLRQNGQYSESNAAWTIAETEILAWERTARTNPGKLLSYLGASTINERMKPYEGQDYEKTWVSTRIALNHLALGNWEHARVAIKRTHEREAIIAAFRGTELASIQTQANDNGWVVTGDNLGGYPVAYINSPDVLALRNSYQNAFSHYLAGYIYEAFNDPSLSAPGYRKAIELNPNSPILQNGLRNMETRIQYSHGMGAKETDVLFIVENDYAPARKPFEVSLPFFYTDKEGEVRAIYIPISFPYIQPSSSPSITTISLGNKVVKSEAIMDLNLMARRALKDEMPGLMFRGLTRAASKGALQYYANELDPIVGLIANIFTVTTELADDRNWRMLPGSISLARTYIKPGAHTLILNGKSTGLTINVDGQYMIINIRMAGQKPVIAEVSSYGTLSTATTPAMYGAIDTDSLRQSSQRTSTAPAVPEAKPELNAEEPRNPAEPSYSPTHQRNRGDNVYRHHLGSSTPIESGNSR